MRVVLDINEKYAKVLSITAIGVEFPTLKVSTHATDPGKARHIILDEYGNWLEVPRED